MKLIFSKFTIRAYLQKLCSKFRRESIAIEVVAISFHEIELIWRSQLWPGRKSSIEPYSSIRFGGGYFERADVIDQHFWGIYSENNLVGVLSGHGTVDGGFRIRGLWVDSLYREHGYGSTLMRHAVGVAKSKNYLFVWIMPRIKNWTFYQKLGFEKASIDLLKFEFGPHWFGVLRLKKNQPFQFSFIINS